MNGLCHKFECRTLQYDFLLIGSSLNYFREKLVCIIVLQYRMFLYLETPKHQKLRDAMQDIYFPK